MGITGLLQMLKPIQKPASVSDFSGQVIGVDAYCWLHKGVYGCAMDLIEGKKTTVYVNYVMRRVNLMLHHKIKPILVFDGGHLPSKADKEKERRSLRKENKAKGLAFLRAGNKVEAVECFQKSVDITPEMALDVIKACRAKGVDCIVAPYEADAQLTYLYKNGIIQVVISEDSDLLVYGCKKVLYKMDAGGNGLLIDLDDLPKLTDLKFHQFSMEKFRHMCILSGCDYLPSVKGIGLMTANKLLRKYSDVWKLLRSLKLGNQYSINQDYVERFKQADQTFLYQTVFDLQLETLAPLTTIPEELKSLDLQFLGPLLPKELAIGIALGNIDPISGDTIADFNQKAISIYTRVQSPTDVSTCANGNTVNYQRHSLTPRPPSWSSSAMYGKGKTLNIQKNLGGLFMDFEHSSHARKPFVPPKVVASNNENKCEEESLDIDDLTDMYTAIKAKPGLKKSLQNSTSNKNLQLRKSRFQNPFRVEGQQVQSQGTNQVSRYFNFKSSSHSSYPELPNSSEAFSTTPSAKVQDRSNCVAKYSSVKPTSDVASSLVSFDNIMPRLPCFVQQHDDNKQGSLEEDSEDKENNLSGSTSSWSLHSSLEENSENYLSSGSLKRKHSTQGSDSCCTIGNDIDCDNGPLKILKSDDSSDSEIQLSPPGRKQVLKEINSPPNETISQCGVKDAKNAKPLGQKSDLIAHLSYKKPKSLWKMLQHDKILSIELDQAKSEPIDSLCNKISDDINDKSSIEIDSGYLSDGEESTTDSDRTASQSSSGCVFQSDSDKSSMELESEDMSRLSTKRANSTGNSAATKVAKKQIMLKAKKGNQRSTGLGRCRSMGITRRTVKASQVTPSMPNLFNYFEYNKRKAKK